MLIECIFCKAKARLPESKEGAKVRCGGCGKVYVARAAGPGARAGSSSNTGLRIALIAGGALAALILVFVIMNSDGPPDPPARVVKEKPVQEPQKDTAGWGSEPVLAVREIYDAAGVLNSNKLLSRLQARGLLANLASEAPDAGHPDPEKLSPSEAAEWLIGYVEKVLKDEGDDSLQRWKPYDGKVLSDDPETATVRVQVDRRDTSEKMESRSYDWRLVREGGRWKAAGWTRYISDDEKKAVVIARQKEVQKVTLDDGSRLLIAEPRPLEHLADTPPELRSQIDQLFARMLDFELNPRENNKAQRELVSIGIPALPVLLTGLYQIRIVDDETASKVNMIDVALKDITGLSQGYSPSAAMGRSDERREAAVKAWFGWWLTYGAKFKERVQGEDLLDTMIVPTERDKREMERRKTGG